MDIITKQAGAAYEKLLLRALEADVAMPGTIADRRLYYLLYYIKAGADLRETGYTKQFIDIRNNVALAFGKILSRELHQHEAIAVARLQEELLHAYNEDHLANIIDRALKVTERLDEAYAMLC